jgi:lipopolysaccharide export system protein LptA
MQTKAKNIIIICITLFLIVNNKITAQTDSQSKGEPIELKNADVLIGSSFQESQQKEYSGNVMFSQANVKVSCDRAIHYEDENRVDLFGHVIIMQEGLILKAASIFYDGNTGIARAFGGVRVIDNKSNLKSKTGVYSTKTQIAEFYENVVFWDDTLNITADTMNYLKKTKYTKAFGNVKIEDDSLIVLSNIFEYDRISLNSYAYGKVFIRGKFNAIYFSADTILNYPRQNFRKAFGIPILYKIDTVYKKISIDTLYSGDSVLIIDNSEFRFDTMTVTCDTMETIRSDSGLVYYFINNVEIVKASTLAAANKAYLYDELDILQLYEKPIVWYDSTQLHGDTINIYFPNNELSHIESLSDAIAVSAGDSTVLYRFNQITGDTITLKFERDSIRSMNAYGSAQSLYFMEKEGSPDGAARSTCDAVSILFELGEVSDIYWLRAVRGEYIPENLVYNNHKEYYLPSFIWSENKPKKKILVAPVKF